MKKHEQLLKDYHDITFELARYIGEIRRNKEKLSYTTDEILFLVELALENYAQCFECWAKNKKGWDFVRRQFLDIYNYVPRVYFLLGLSDRDLKKELEEIEANFLPLE